MPTVPVRLSEKELVLLDEVAARSDKKNRSDVLRRGLFRLAVSEFKYTTDQVNEIRRSGVAGYKNYRVTAAGGRSKKHGRY